MSSRYPTDVLGPDGSGGRRQRGAVRDVAAEPGLVVECAVTGWCGAVVGWQKGADGLAVVLEDRKGTRRPFALRGSFLVDGELVSLVRPAAKPAPAATARTASGSIAAPAQRAQVARGSRIWVEGKHDAELVERIWGADLRGVGVVVEELGGVDDLVEHLAEFGPGPAHRVGVLVDHLVTGSKETRIAQKAHERWPDDVLVLGHPYVDVWQAVRPQVAGISTWPTVPPGTPWKEGVCERLGWGADTGAAWRALLARVNTFADLEPSLLGRVEELIDFVTATDV